MTVPRRVAFGSDHAGFALKAELMKAAREGSHQVEDLGPLQETSVDYPDYARTVSEAVAQGRAELGVLTCGTGIGMSISANKTKGVRAALCHTELEAKMARAHNDANVLCLGQRITGSGLAKAILEAFLATDFEGGRHALRVDKIRAQEA